jgi:hypothetical protein
VSNDQHTAHPTTVIKKTKIAVTVIIIIIIIIVIIIIVVQKEETPHKPPQITIPGRQARSTIKDLALECILGRSDTVHHTLCEVFGSQVLIYGGSRQYWGGNTQQNVEEDFSKKKIKSFFTKIDCKPIATTAKALRKEYEELRLSGAANKIVCVGLILRRW